MGKRGSIVEVVLTAIIFIVGCCGLGVTVHKRVDKGSGQLTTENYTKYLKVECSLGNIGVGGGNTLRYPYYVIVNPVPWYALEGVTITYSLESDGADLPDGILEVSVKAGERYEKEFQDEFTVREQDDALGMMKRPTLKITVNSVSGIYRYSM